MAKLVTNEKSIRLKKNGDYAYIMMSRYGFNVGDIVDVYKEDDDTLVIKRVKKGGE